MVSALLESSAAKTTLAIASRLHPPPKPIFIPISHFQSKSKTADTLISEHAQLLKSCIQSKSLNKGKTIHNHLLKTNLLHLNLLENICHLYIVCDRIKLARLIFGQIDKPNAFLWNSMIRAYAWSGPFDQAIDLYYHMYRSKTRPNKFTFPFALKACSTLLALEDAREIHNHAREVGLDSDLFVSTALVDVYTKCGCLSDAHEVFARMPERDIVAWNAMVAGSALHGLFEDAIGFVFKMQRVGISVNSSTVVAVLPVVGQAKALGRGKSIHGFCIRRCFIGDLVVDTALLDMYAKCELLLYSRRIFESMSVRNEVTWSAMIGARVLCDPAGALALFDDMMLVAYTKLTSATLGIVLRACSMLNDVNRGRQIHGYSSKTGLILDLKVGNSLLSMYSKCGFSDDSIRLFDEMLLKDTVSYGAIISGYVQNGNAEEALLIFREMQQSGRGPDLATLLGVIPACAHLSALQYGRCSHGYAIVRGFASDISIGNALIDMYAKCGKIDTAKQVFDRMQKWDIISWNAMIAAYGIHGLGTRALALFHKLLSTGLELDEITFINIFLACSHSGHVAEGKHWFSKMSEEFKIAPRMEHYICMVDLLGRGGFLDEAYDLIKRMPLEPDVRVWGALLGACRIHKNISLGEEVSVTIQKLGPVGTGNFVLLSNIYSAAGRWDDAANIRMIQRDQGFKKSPGCSWIEIGGTMHAFIGGDQSHPQLPVIYDKLMGLLGEMKKLGYHADTSFVLQDVEEEEKEHLLLYHSEKLAIAFGIINSSPSKPIFVSKNLRICGDCHTAIKLISSITKRLITVRDATRFHHFKDGICDCRDFW